MYDWHNILLKKTGEKYFTANTPSTVSNVIVIYEWTIGQTFFYSSVIISHNTYFWVTFSLELQNHLKIR